MDVILVTIEPVSWRLEMVGSLVLVVDDSSRHRHQLRKYRMRCLHNVDPPTTKEQHYLYHQRALRVRHGEKSRREVSLMKRATEG